MKRHPPQNFMPVEQNMTKKWLAIVNRFQSFSYQVMIMASMPVADLVLALASNVVELAQDRGAEAIKRLLPKIKKQRGELTVEFQAKLNPE
jgi:hypothetical protein